jgi:hypothetical protein
MTITVSGTTITFNDSTTQTTAPTGTVSSVATGNGLSGGTITTSGTLVVACPTFNSVGSYCEARFQNNNITVTAGSNYAAGGTNIWAAVYYDTNPMNSDGYNILSGTWKWMGGGGNYAYPAALACRVS